MRNIDLFTRAVDLLMRNIDLFTRAADLLTRNIDLSTRNIDLSTRDSDLARIRPARNSIGCSLLHSARRSA